MASWLTGLVDALKEGDIQGAVAKTQSGISGLKDNIAEGLKEKAADIDAAEGELRKEREKLGESRSLPWEVPEDKSIVGEDLMERVLSLSLEETNFTEEPKPPTHFSFDMERHVQVIVRLLELDPNLTKAHYRLSAKMDERVFWRNYFHRCALLRAEVGVGNPLRRKLASDSAGGGSGGGAGGAGGGSNGGAADDSDSSGGRSSKSPYAGSEGTLVEGEGGDEGGGSSGSGGAASSAEDKRKKDEEDDLAALDAEVNAELGIGGDSDGDGSLGDDLDDDDDDLDGELDAELEAEIAAELGGDDLE